MTPRHLTRKISLMDLDFLKCIQGEFKEQEG